jgi:hypothetical protein
VADQAGNGNSFWDIVCFGWVPEHLNRWLIQKEKGLLLQALYN